MQVARWLHLMGVVVWVGGMLFAHVALRPSAAALPPPVRLPLLAATLSRFFLWAGVSVVAILVTGGWMAHALGGFRAIGPAIQAMTAIGLVMALVYGYIVAAPYRTLRAAIAASHWEAGGAAMATIRRLVVFNLVLGIATIAIAVLGARGVMRAFGFAGWSGSGKTTLIERVVPRLVARGLAVSLVKHAHHEFDIDQPGKDSFRHREAGCVEVLVSSSRRWALMHELRGAGELTLGAALAQLSPCDIVLVEGYKRARLPKLEVHRAAVAKPWLHPDDPDIVGIASDVPPPSPGGRPVLQLDGYDEIATFVAAHARPLAPSD